MSRNVWLPGALTSTASAVFCVAISWYPRYRQDGRGVTPDEYGVLSPLVLAGGAVGCVTGWCLTDWLTERTGSAVLARCRLGTAAYLVGGAGLWLGVRADTPAALAAGTCVAVFCIQVQIPAWWATVMGISGRHVGALSGLTNSLGVIGAILSQLFVGALADRLGDVGYAGRDRWDPGMSVYVGVMVAGAVLWAFVRPGVDVDAAG